jgi:hypothetical protein
MKESDVESYLVESVEKLGGQCMKAGQNGWPDQIVILPHSFLIWVEVKRPARGKRPAGKRRKSQIQCVNNLKQLGQHAVFIDRPAQVDAMLKWYVQQLAKGPMSDPRR